MKAKHFLMGSGGLALVWLLAGPSAVALAESRNQPDEDPEAVLFHYPTYPRDSLLNEQKGHATVVMSIDRDGNVVDAELEDASHRHFAEASLRAVEHWRFKPQRRHGKAVPVRVRQRFNFQVNEDSFYSMEVLNARKVGVHPVPYEIQRPEYPEGLKSKKIGGHSDIVVTISPKGRVVDASIEGATHDPFGQAALEAAKTWRFKPVHPHSHYRALRGRVPDYIDPDFGHIRARLTFRFHPETSGRDPSDIQTTNFRTLKRKR